MPRSITYFIILTFLIVPLVFSGFWLYKKYVYLPNQLSKQKQGMEQKKELAREEKLKKLSIQQEKKPLSPKEQEMAFTERMKTLDALAAPVAPITAAPVKISLQKQEEIVKKQEEDRLSRLKSLKK